MSRFFTPLSSPALQSAQRGLRLAVHRTGPVWLGMFALGLGLGVLVTSNGLPWWLAPILSGAVYAGSVEFLLVAMGAFLIFCLARHALKQRIFNKNNDKKA